MTLDLYILTAAGTDPRNARVVSQSDSAPFPLPGIVFGETLNVRVYLVTGAGGFDAVSGAAGYAPRLAIGQQGSAAVALTEDFAQITNGWSCTLELTTTNLRQVLAALASRKLALEFSTVTTPAGNRSTWASLPIEIIGRVDDPAEGDAVAAPVYYTAAQADAFFCALADPRLTDSRPPNGGAGGVLSGSYPNPGFAVNMATQAELLGHTSRADNPHSVTKAQVGLGSVENVALSTWAGSTNLATLAPTLANINSVAAASGSAMLLAGGGAGAATASIGKGSDGRIVFTPGTTISSGYEYFDIQSNTGVGVMGGDSFGMRTIFTLNHSSAPFHGAAGLLQMNIPSSNNTDINEFFAGGYGYISHRGGGVFGDARAFNAYVDVYGTGDIVEASAYFAKGTNNTGTGRIRKFYGLKVATFANTTGRTWPDSLIGVYVENLGTNAGTYAIKTDGDTPSLLGPLTAASYTTGGVISTTGASNSTGLGTGVLFGLGGGSITQDWWVGKRLIFPATGTTNAIGLAFGTESYLFRDSANTLRFTANTLTLSGTIDVIGQSKLEGTVGIGDDPNSGIALYVRSASLNGTNQYGGLFAPTFTTAATAGGRVLAAQLKTAASAFTLAAGTAFDVLAPAPGSLSAVTTIRGIRVANQGVASTGFTNAIGIDIEAQSGASTLNLGLRNAGLTQLTNATDATTSTAALDVTGGILARMKLVTLSTISTQANVAWNLGAVTAGAVSLDTANYVAVTIGGAAVKLLKAA